ncbi:DUF4190 domain-containing protein [Antribacter gilvus]|uniref:DUF4190 domain-containing protein n=1 Tax=Antribacter gilvus TaxID=2304675 RepID=UPI000F789014|nr:DUF4190 domain-containing protein [Antribacter gilvus]
MTQADGGWSSPPPQPEQPYTGQPEQPYATQPQPDQQPYGPPYSGAQPDLTQQYAGQPYQGQPGQPGQQYPAYGYAPAPVMPKNDLGVLSLVFGILGVIGFGLLGGIPAIILAKKAREAERAGLANNGTLATVGFVTGWIGIAIGILTVLVIIGYLILIGVMVASEVSY